MSWTFRNTPGAPEPNDAQIDEELLFHLRSAVEDNLAKGMPADQAWEDARRRFGSLRGYSAQCRSERSGLGLRRALALLAILIVAITVGGLWLEVASLRRQQIEAHRLDAQTFAQLAKLAATRDNPGKAPRPPAEQSVAPAGPWHDLAGTVLDDAGQPLADTTVLIIVKTWPGGRYQQQSFSATSNEWGEFRLPEKIPDSGQYAVLVAALKPGYALTSEYQLHSGPGQHPLDPVSLRLPQAAALTLVVQDGSNQPVDGARILPFMRRSAAGQQHLVYFQGSEPIQMTADHSGLAALSCFQRGDQAEIYIQLPGKDWVRHRIKIPEAADRIVISDDGTPSDAS